MPNRQKQKGDRAERAIVQKLKGLGLHAQRVPLSGAAGGYFGGDLTIEVPGLGNILGEVKSRQGGGGFKLIEAWLGSNDLLFLKRDREDPLVVMPWEVFERFIERVVSGTTDQGSERRPAGPVPGPMEPEEIDAELDLQELDRSTVSDEQYFGTERT